MSPFCRAERRGLSTAPGGPLPGHWCVLHGQTGAAGSHGRTLSTGLTELPARPDQGDGVLCPRELVAIAPAAAPSHTPGCLLEPDRVRACWAQGHQGGLTPAGEAVSRGRGLHCREGPSRRDAPATVPMPEPPVHHSPSPDAAAGRSPHLPPAEALWAWSPWISSLPAARVRWGWKRDLGWGGEDHHARAFGRRPVTERPPMQRTPWVGQGRPGPLMPPTGCCRPCPSHGCWAASHLTRLQCPVR